MPATSGTKASKCCRLWAEVLAIAHKAGLRVHISHIKVSGRRAWGRAPDMIALIRRRNVRKARVSPRPVSLHGQQHVTRRHGHPPRFREGSAKDLLDRLDDREAGPRMKKEIEKLIDGRQGGKSFRIANYSPRPDWHGKDLDAIATQEKKSLLDLVLKSSTRAAPASSASA